MKENNGIEWFNVNIKPLIENDYDIKYISEKDGDFGDLYGVQFDSEQKGGYIYMEFRVY